MRQIVQSEVSNGSAMLVGEVRNVVLRIEVCDDGQWQRETNATVCQVTCP